MNLILLTPVVPVLFQFLAWTISLAWAWATSAFSTENFTAARTDAASTADTEKETANTSTAASHADTEQETANTSTAVSDADTEHSTAENNAASDFFTVKQRKKVDFIDIVLHFDTKMREQAEKLEMAQKKINANKTKAERQRKQVEFS